jgi:hypothetical protein
MVPPRTALLLSSVMGVTRPEACVGVASAAPVDPVLLPVAPVAPVEPVALEDPVEPLALVAVGLGSSSSLPQAARKAALKAVAPVAARARRLPTLRDITESQ